MLLAMSCMELRTSLEAVQLALHWSISVHELRNRNNGMSLQGENECASLKVVPLKSAV
jgi:hypothetical protein